jgi:hypothetical protein
MYDQLFSKYWVLDRCFEGAHYWWAITFLILLFLLSGITLELNKLLITKIKNKLFRYVVLILINLIAVQPLFMSSLVVISVVGHLLIGCSYGTFFDPIIAGHKLNAELKEKYKYHQVPTTWQEVCQIKPEECLVIEKNSKHNYIYNSETGRYTLFIRPSKHGLAIFDPSFDFGVYALVKGKPLSDDFRLYPPKNDGPWDQYPR